MTQSLHAVTFLVRDYDEAISWFVTKLEFCLIEDTPLSGGKRWVKVATKGGGVCLLLAKAEGEEQKRSVGQAAGGRVAFFLHCQSFQAAYARMTAAHVVFTEEPRHEPYGTVAVFLDLYGNKWDLIEPQK